MSKTYTYQNGETVTLPEIVVPEESEKCIQVNLPSTAEDFENGNGEGMFACATEETYQEWDSNGEGIHFVKLLNDSVYYPGLSWGTIIPVELRGKDRPVALLEELQHHYGDSKRDEVIQFLPKNLEF